MHTIRTVLVTVSMFNPEKEKCRYIFISFKSFKIQQVRPQGAIPILRQQKDWVGEWVRKMAIFADLQYCIYANIVGGWVRKSKKKYILT